MPAAQAQTPLQTHLFDTRDTGIADEILKIDPDTLTPLEALNVLHRLRQKITKGDYH